MPKNVVIYSDGTGQAGGFAFDERRSNIYKLFRATRCGPDSSVDPACQVAFYDPGLGSQADGGHLIGRLGRWIYNTASQATGFGITANIIDCYAALIRLWQPGDRIFLVGFSRGAYTVRSLAGVISLCGVPTTGKGGVDLPLDEAGSQRIAAYAVKHVYQFTASRSPERATPRQRFLLRTRARLAARFRAQYGSNVDHPIPPETIDENSPSEANVYPYFIGVFDTVAALGSGRKFSMFAGAYLAVAGVVSLLASLLRYVVTAPILEGVVNALTFGGVFIAFIGFAAVAALMTYVATHVKFDFKVPEYSFRERLATLHVTQLWQKFFDTNLNSNVAYAKHAISIDENRKDFARVGWGQKHNTRSANDDDGNIRFEQVWFAGCHSDIGGSYPENESRLSDVALHWMLSRAQTIPDGLIYDADVLRLWPDPSGIQHDEVKAGLGLVTKLLGLTWTQEQRKLPSDDATMHRSVYKRFDHENVSAYDRRKAYRPMTLANHVDFARYYGSAEQADSEKRATAVARNDELPLASLQPAANPVVA